MLFGRGFVDDYEIISEFWLRWVAADRKLPTTTIGQIPRPPGALLSSRVICWASAGDTPEAM